MEEFKQLALKLAGDLKHELKVDTRFVVFDTEIDGNVIEFRVSSEFLRQKIDKRFEETYLPAEIDLQIQVLPKLSEGESEAAICNTTVAPIRQDPSHLSEQTTQVLLGEVMDVLETKTEFWTRVRLRLDGYIGWVSTGQIVGVSKTRLDEWESSRKKIASIGKSSDIKSAPSAASDVITELIAGSSLPVIDVQKKWYRIQMPDGREGFVQKDAATLLRKTTRSITSKEIIATARRFLGTSYLWGGRSAKGIDCSGFSQTVFRLNGIEIPRDASLQWECGTEVGKKPEDLVEGDLVFFSGDGTNITHVGIALGNHQEYIHASGFVRINSFDPSRKNFEPWRRQTYIGARRLGKIE